MNFAFDRPVLALADASAAGTNAAWRAALVARDHGLPLRLLHAGSGEDAARLQRGIRERLGLLLEAVPVAGDPLPQVVHAARAASLLVLGSRRGNPLRELVLGTQAERLLRLCRVPVLVVKRAVTASYRRVLVPVDLHSGAAQVLALAGRFSRDPRMEVLHAVDVRDEVTMRAFDLPEVVMRRQRQRTEQRTRGHLEELLARAGFERDAVRPSVAFGDAAAAVLARERALRAELVVLGKRRRGLLADFFLGSVTQRVLASARADVLVLPVGEKDGAVGACWPVPRSA